MAQKLSNTMNIYAIVLKQSNHEVSKRIQDVYPDSYPLTDTFFLVQSKGIAKTVAISIGIKGDDKIESASGAVFKLNHSYSGYTDRALWDWLEQAQEHS